MRRPPRRPSRAREHDAQDVGVLVLVDEPAEREQLPRSLRRVPPGNEARPCTNVLEVKSRNRSVDVAQLVLEDEFVVLPRLDVHEQAVERRDVDAGRVEPALERLHERRPRAGERIEHATARDVALEQGLVELRNELA